VPYPPAGGIDIVGRFIAPRLSERLGQPVIVENRPGATGMIGTELVYRAPPDGYTYIIASADSHSINPHVYTDVRYKAQDFSAAAPIAKLDYVLVGRSGVPANTAKEIFELAKRTELTYASGGVGTSAHAVTETFKNRYGLKLLHVPYGGSGPAVTAIMSGQVDIVLLPVVIATSNRSKLKIFGLVSDKRFEGAPDIPTLTEQGYPIDLDSVWVGLMAPPKTPRAVLQEVHRHVHEIVSDKDSKDRLISLGMFPFDLPLDEFSRYVEKEYERWGGVIKTAEIRVDNSVGK
jgi:tripartite-type tricarboxylate transporter receptor subunit TctC